MKRSGEYPAPWGGEVYYARSSDGKSWLWVGRSKTAGRGEAASQLRFDVAVKATTLR